MPTSSTDAVDQPTRPARHRRSPRSRLCSFTQTPQSPGRRIGAQAGLTHESVGLRDGEHGIPVIERQAYLRRVLAEEDSAEDFDAAEGGRRRLRRRGLQLLLDELQNGKHERSRLAGPGLGGAADVAAAKDGGQRLILYGSRQEPVLLLDAAQELRAEAVVVPIGHSLTAHFFYNLLNLGANLSLCVYAYVTVLHK